MYQNTARLTYPSAARRRRTRRTPAPIESSAFSIKRRNRFWEVVDAAGNLVCLTVYKRGAVEVVRRLEGTAEVRPIMSLG
jgi:hypothetical protein